jgi:O-succinylbenzoic acid--CoA ligase
MERHELARLLGAAGGYSGADTPVFIADRDRAGFMQRFAAAAAGSGPVFLGDPGWAENQRPRWEPLVAEARRRGDPGGESGWLMIPTGGTSGGMRFARHGQDTLEAAVHGFCRHFDLPRVNAVGVLPLYHVSGLLAWFRCALTGGVHLPWDWKALEAGDRPALTAGDWVISLVPTQLQRLLADATAVDWLRRFRVIFLGGGPVWPELADAAAAAGLRISLSYGMTETAAMVAALRPEEFLRGARGVGTALPHVRITIGDDGAVIVEGGSVFHGYYPEWREERRFETGDLGRFDEHGHLHLLGRRDAVIITGGKKVQPLEVEAALRASGELEDVAVLGVPDSEWGELVVAFFPASQRPPDPGKAAAKLAGYQRPKHYVPVDPWPRNAQGKVDRAALRVIWQTRSAR